LTLRENWRQIGTVDGDFLHFFSSWRSFWECIHALLIVVFTREGSSWGGVPVGDGGCDRLRARI
jgi:hypothetical protein